MTSDEEVSQKSDEMLLLKFWVLALAAFGTGERIHLQSMINASHEIKVGASEAEVSAILGEPDHRWEPRGVTASIFFGPRARLWIYSTTIEPGNVVVPGLPFVNPIPISLRLFSPSESDLVIHWSAKDQVMGIDRPQFGLPKDSEKLLQPIHFVKDLVIALGKPPQ